jgi:multiple sugar transport system permease protein
MAYTLQRYLARTLIYALLILLTALCVLPFYSMVIASTHSDTVISTQLNLTPGARFWSNYGRLMERVNIWRGFLNSSVITVSATTLVLYFSALCAFGFSKYTFRGSGLLFSFVLATLMIPGQLGIVGFFKMMEVFRLLNTYWPLILPSVANAFGIFFLKQICDSSVPDELLDAGRIDGAGELQLFHRVVFPLLVPAVATLGIFTFIGKWNEFFMPLIILFDNEKQPLPVMIAYTRGQYATEYGAQYVGIVLSVIPILLVFSFASKRIISGVTVGALKG